MNSSLTLGLFTAAFISSASYANSPTATQKLAWEPAKQAADTYRACLSKAYYAEAKSSSEKPKIAQSAIDACASEKLVLSSLIAKILPKKTVNEQKSIQQSADSMALDIEKNYISELHTEIERNAARNLHFIAMMRGILYNCSDLNWKHGINVYAFATSGLSKDYAYYANSTANRKRELAKTIEQIDTRIAKVGAKQWCSEAKALFGADTAKNMSPFR